MIPTRQGRDAMLLGLFFIQFSFVLSTAIKSDNEAFSWDLIEPTEDLQWAPCFQNFTCTKLKVPLDYSKPNFGSTGIAFIKYTPPGALEDRKNIVMNFGGPGGSGVESLIGYAPTISSFLGGKHNIVSFDPRGVGESGPVVDCFPGQPKARNNFANIFYGDVTNASSISLQTQFYSSALFGEWCSQAIGHNNTQGLYISTPAVAEDMLTYAKAEKKASGNLKNHAQLWYYGLSYGTALGVTFASMFPDNVGRIILDGVIDAEDYYRNGWKTNLYQTDQTLASFSFYCHKAGPKNCSFWGPSTSNITDRIDAILGTLKFEPIPVTNFGNSETLITGLATYSDLKTMMFQSLYQPISGFPEISDVFAALEKGIGFDPSLASSFLKGPDVNAMIRCVDGYGHNNFSSLAEYEEYVDLLIKQSKYFGEVWPNNASPALCRSLRLAIPKISRFNGSSPPSASNTSNPLLFISSSIDPVSPAVGAYKMAKGFPGSAVLIQEAVGHTAIAQGGSDCMFNYIQAYLQDGSRLPPVNTSCSMQLVPFKDSLSSSLSI